MKRWLKIWFWKKQLKKHYRRYSAVLDDYDCGYKLAEYISPRLRESKEGVNKAVRRLRDLDPECELSELP